MINNKVFLESGREAVIVHEFKYENQTLCVFYLKGDYTDNLKILDKNRFYAEEQTEIFKLKKEIEKLQKEKEAEIKKIQDEAIKGLETRVRINMAFGMSNAAELQVAATVIKQLQNMIEDKKP